MNMAEYANSMQNSIAKEKMGKNMDGKSSIRGGGVPTPNGKSHEISYFLGISSLIECLS